MKRKMNPKNKIWFVIFVSLLMSCSQISEPEEVNISGRYQSDQYAMILLLEHYYKQVSATLEWDGYTTKLEGHYDSKNNQVLMSGNYFGHQNVSFSLFYKDKSLAGGFNYNGRGATVNFKFMNLLKSHNQGGSRNESY